jgi:hypothetical protein
VGKTNTSSFEDSAFAFAGLISFDENLVEEYDFSPLTLYSSLEDNQESKRIISPIILEHIMDFTELWTQLTLVHEVFVTYYLPHKTTNKTTGGGMKKHNLL